MLAPSNSNNSQVARGMNDDVLMPRNYSGDATGTTAQSNANAEGSILTTGSKRKKPKLVLTIPNSTNSVSNTSVATDLSSQGGQSILNGFEGMTGGTQTNFSNSRQMNNMLNGRMPPPPPPPGPHHHHHGSISLLRTASAESSTGGMTPLSTALISPNHVGATPTTALHAHPNHHHVSTYLIPQFSGMSLLSPTIPLSPNVNGGLTTPSAAAAAQLTRMNSAESVGTVKIINDGELTRTDSLTSTTSFPPPLMRSSSQPMTPGANSYSYHQQQHQHARGWTTVETPRLHSNGHFVPFPSLISPTPRTAAGGTPTAQQQPRHFFASHHHVAQQQQQQQQQYQPSPHLGATTAAAAAYHQRFHHHHHHLPAAATAAPGSVPMHQPSYPNHQYHHAQLASRATHPMFGATTATTAGGFPPSGWNVMSSMPMMTTPQQMPQQQQQQPMPRSVHHLTQQVHHGLMSHHSHLHHHRGGGGANVAGSSDLYSMKDGSGMSSSVSVGSNSSRKTGDETRCDQFYKMKMQAKNEVGSMPVCRHWVKGTCWYGSTCKFRHPDDE